MGVSKDWRPNINKMSFEALRSDISRKLEVLFFEEEVFVVLFSLSEDKALRLHHFTMVF